jgi:type IV secretory pathway VirB4 component
MPADLDQFGRKYSNGAVIGGKGLVKLGHMAANRWCLVDEVNLKTSCGKIQRGLNTADPSTDNHDVSKIAAFETFSNTVCETFTNLVFNSLYFFVHFRSPHDFPITHLPAGRQGFQKEITQILKISGLFQKSLKSLPGEPP